MNDPTSILGQIRKKGGVASARRGVYVLAFVLLFLAIGSVPGRETGTQGFALQATSKAARADTLADQTLVDGDASQVDLLSTRTRHKTH
jgi:hypothetical protein